VRFCDRSHLGGRARVRNARVASLELDCPTLAEVP
jgi:hypothetical protein